MNTIYPVITLYQPWATWIMRGWKTIETRTHNKFACLSHRTILIHSGMKVDNSPDVINNPYLSREQILYNPEEVVSGYILGSVKVQAFRSLEERNSKAALIDCKGTYRFGLFLEDIKVFEKPILCKGEMGIWYFDMEKMQKVKKNSADTDRLF
jgi:hypothetical protein